VFWALFFISLTLVSCIYWLVAGWCVASFFAERQTRINQSMPPVSILKPARGVDAEAYANFASFLAQDYPADYEVLFGVSDPRDPVLELVERLQQEFPQRRIRSYVAPRRGANDKVSILCHLAEQAQHDYLVISDSDVRVTPGYLRRVCAPLTDPAVGLVTCLYRGDHAQTLTARLEALYMGTTFLPSVMVGRHYLHMGFALGASNAIRRDTLQQIGGFESIVDYLADDYQLGLRVARSGRRVHLSNYVTQIVVGATTFREQWAREVRWAKCFRVSRPLEYLPMMIIFSTPIALLSALVQGFSAASLAILGGTLTLRWLVGAQMAHYTRDRVFRSAWWWLPLRDLLTSAIWCVAIVGRHVSWRGREFLLREGCRLQHLHSTEPWTEGEQQPSELW